MLFTWKADAGLTVYLNGGERGVVAEPIETQGHTAEKNSNLVIGHTNNLAPSKRASAASSKLYLSICTLFETHINGVEATKIFVYYWGHSKYLRTATAIWYFKCLTITLPPLNGPYGPMTNTGKNNFLGG